MTMQRTSPKGQSQELIRRSRRTKETKKDGLGQCSLTLKTEKFLLALEFYFTLQKPPARLLCTNTSFQIVSA